jgi:hypothetical protein
MRKGVFDVLLISADGEITTLKGVVDPSVMARWLAVAVQKARKGVQ